MYRYLTIIVLLCLSTLTSCAQDLHQHYQGEWVGFLPDKTSFNFEVTIRPLEGNRYHLTIANDKKRIDENLESFHMEHLQFNIDEQLFFDLRYDQNKQTLTGFIKSGRLLYHLSLTNDGNEQFMGNWNPFMLNNGLQSDDIMLYVEGDGEGGLVGYPFFGDQRFRGTWTGDFRLKENTLVFTDANTGFNFQAELLKDTIELEIMLTDALVTKTSLKHTDDGWEYSSDPVRQTPNTNTPKR
ncbi:MAG: hypothetical protein AAF361_03385, partial [Bacteroidota bacterium]